MFNTEREKKMYKNIFKGWNQKYIKASRDTKWKGLNDALVILFVHQTLFLETTKDFI